MGMTWASTSIGEIAEVYDGPHATPAKTANGPIFLGISNLVNGRIDLTSTEHLSEDDFVTWTRRVRPQPGDVVFSYETRLGEAALIPEGLRCCLGRRMGLLRPRANLVDSRFLLYAYLSPEFQQTLRQRTIHGSTVDRIPLIEMPSFPMRLPPLPEQRAIAAVLGALDDKIELNRRMNATLEGLARALFKAWFVDFEPVRAKMAGRPTGLPAEIDALFPDEMEVGEEGVERPRGWRVQVLKDLVEYVIGGDWGKDERSEEFPAETYCIRGADIPSLQGGGLGSMPSRYLKLASLEKRSLRPGDLVVEISGGSPTQSTGRPVLVTKGLLSRLDKPLVCSNFCRLVRPQDEPTGSSASFRPGGLYQRDDFLAYENGTTGIKNFAFTLFSEQFPLCMPPDALMRAFEKVATSLFERMQLNGSQSDTVAKLRDALLPKLMSGEVRV
mgnify:CR=1 FL=1